MLTKLKRFIINYPERIILVIAILVLLYTGLSTMSEATDQPLDSVKTKTGQLRQILSSNKLPEDQKPPALNALEEIKKNWNDEFLQKPAKINNWLMYRQPVCEVTFNARPRAKPKQLPVPVLKNLAVDAAQPDYVKITWAKNPEPGPETVQTSGYKIYRRAEGEDKFTNITEPALTVESLAVNSDGDYEYLDKTVAARTGYKYYVAALTDESNVERTESVYEPAKEKETVVPDNVKLVFSSATPGGEVWIKIEKFINAKWLHKYAYYKKGEQVGKGEFATYYKIKDILEDEIIKQVGNEKTKTPAFRIIYEDDRGNVRSETVKKQSAGGQ